jgi:hypothetical protein
MANHPFGYPPLAPSFESLREIAEAGLRNARDNLEAAVERQGKSIRGIFAGSYFIPRSTGEQWLDNAGRRFLERERENFAEVRAALNSLKRPRATTQRR